MLYHYILYGPSNPNVLTISYEEGDLIDESAVIDRSNGFIYVLVGEIVVEIVEYEKVQK